MSSYNTCRECGGPAPEGEELCWFCSHKTRLPDTPEECGEDSCPMELPEGGQSNE